MSYFIDATITEALRSSVVVSKEDFLPQDGCDDAPPLPPRVLPLLVDCLKRKSQSRQRLHLESFVDGMAALDSVAVTEDDAYHFLAVVFTLQRRTDGYTRLQMAMNSKVSELCFRILCRVFTRPHRHHATFLAALKALTGALLALPQAGDGDGDGGAPAQDSAAEQKRRLLDERARDISEAGARVQRRMREAELAAGGGSEPQQGGEPPQEQQQHTQEQEQQEQPSSSSPQAPPQPEPEPEPATDAEANAKRTQEEAEAEAKAKAPHVVVGGLRVDAGTFNLDHFLERDDSRAHAAALLECLDASGVDVGVFTRCGWEYVPRQLAAQCRVFRDFTCCPPVPRQTCETRADPTQLHFKTNIAMRSDIKYRFHFEGVNWGVNQPVNCVAVGSAGLHWDRIDEMAYFGWPDGWDKNTTVCYTGGIGKLTQYFSSDGFVTIILEAKCVLNLGISASAWLTCCEHGNDHPLSATWHYTRERL